MANSPANASKKMGTAKKSSKKKNKKPNKKAGRIALLVILCVLVVGMLTTAIIGGYVFFNIVSFAHGSLAVSHMNSNIPGKIFGGFLLLMGIKELFRKGD